MVIRYSYTLQSDQHEKSVRPGRSCCGLPAVKGRPAVWLPAQPGCCRHSAGCWRPPRPPTGKAGQELLWRGDSLDELLGKCQGGVNSGSKDNGECQKWCLLASDPLGERKGKKAVWGGGGEDGNGISDSGESSNRPLSLQHTP